jgi:predicted deacetylase
LYAALSVDDVSPVFCSVAKLKTITDFLRQVNVPATFFVIPNYHNSFPLTQEMRECLRVVVDSGHEVGLHGYSHMLKEFGHYLPFPFPTYGRQQALLKKGKESLADSVGVDPLGFRAPNYRHNSSTLKALEDLDFRYDSSRTLFKPLRANRFRIRVFSNPRPTLVRRLVEIPVTGDYTWDLKARQQRARRYGSVFLQAYRKALTDLQLIRNVDGAFVINAHVQHLDWLGINLLGKLVTDLSRTSKFLRLRDLARICVQRNSGRTL